MSVADDDVVCSDSTEETQTDNRDTVTIPIRYETEIILSRSVCKPQQEYNGLIEMMHNPENWKPLTFFYRESQMEVYFIHEGDEIANPIKTFSDIGPEFKFKLKVSDVFFSTQIFPIPKRETHILVTALPLDQYQALKLETPSINVKHIHSPKVRGVVR